MCKFCEIGVHNYENKASYQKGYQVVQGATLTSVVHVNITNISVMQTDINYCPMCGIKLIKDGE